MEVWKDIAGYEGKYQISDIGRVKSFVGISPRILKPQLNSQGYYQVTLTGKKILVHVLVARGFIINPKQYNVVNHIDHNPKNNAADNLEWCTHSHNQLHSINSNRGRLGSQCHKANISEKEARVIFRFSEYLSCKDISIMMGVSASIIYKIKRGESWNQVTGLPRKRHYKIKSAA